MSSAQTHSPGFSTSRTAAPGLEQRLLQRITMGWTMAEQQRIEQVGYNAYLEEQLDYESIDDSELEGAIAEAFPALERSSGSLFAQFVGNRQEAYRQVITATLLRSIYSRRQLFQRMAVFWSDHFSIDLFAGRGYMLKIVDDREVVRRHALGRFPEMLQASAHSPAMLEYLTNESNVKNHPNENYARELMELDNRNFRAVFPDRDYSPREWGVIR